MADLSPAAQAVLDAFLAEWNDCFLQQDSRCIAAALRAAADQMRSPKDLGLWGNGYWAGALACETKLRSIAAELEKQ